MLVKFETKSNRVKGVAFHPKRPWVLASLHNGVVQLWDYRMGTMIDRYEEHDGPVRGIHFHSSQPLFVSGGDDYKIKVWNYKQRKCIFTLLGHLDYIRTVFFHHEYPWIISSSDDQTVRIWNWQSRQCIAILTGHNHYVMCAQFHPKEDLIVSCSLDQTVRVWDISGLRKKAAMPGPSSYDENPNKQVDLFGNTDAIVKYVLEGHDRGVNWCTFHPSLPLIVSAGDDRQVKLWRMNESKAWEVDTCRGHFNNVSCAIFHPRQELILSNSEDKSIRVWDMSKRTGVQTYRREHDRYWVINAHPDQNLFAAGHDSGLVVFKLERERPAYTTQGDTVFYVKDKFLRSLDIVSGRDVPLTGIRRSSGPNGGPRTLSYNQAEHAFLVCSRADGGTYELYQPPKDSPKDMSDYIADAKRGVGRAAIFIARSRFAVLDKSSQVEIKNLKNELTKSFKVASNVDQIYYGGTGNILLRAEDSVSLYDINQKKVIAEVTVQHVKYVIWSNDQNYVALLAKHCITICNRKLEQLCVLHETVRIKSGAWDDLGIFIYSTLNHVKYALLNGDNGVIRTLDQPLYIVRAKGNTIHSLDRDGKARVLSVDPTEYRFKLALINRKYDEVLSIIRTSNLVGQSIIAYLEKKGYPEIALLFVRDELTRFNLALECGNLQVAQETAMSMDKEEIWSRLATEALRLGNPQVVETALRRIKNVERLSFLYVLLGDTEKLRKMLKIAEMRNDPMSRFNNALYLGDVDEQLTVLREVGQTPVAYLLAKTHGLDQEAEKIWVGAGNEADKAPQPREGTLLVPPVPILRHQELSWPTLNVAKSAFDMGSSIAGATSSVAAATAQAAVSGLADEDLGEVGDEWGGDELEGIDDDGELRKPMKAVAEEAGDGGGWDIDDVEIEGGDVGGPSKAAETETYFVPPTQGITDSEIWVRNSNLAADHIAAGAFESAMQLLNQQVGIVNFAPLKPIFFQIYYGSRTAFSENASVTSQLYPVHRNWEETKPRSGLPYQANSLSKVVESLQSAYKLVTAGKFQEAINAFEDVLHHAILLVVSTKQELNELQQVITIAREYLLGIKMEIARKDVSSKEDKESQVRNAELAAYFTHVGLQPIHLMLSLRSAMTVHYKLKNLLSASSFARRLLELGPKPEIAASARKLQAACDKAPQDDVRLNYSEQNPFVICGSSFTPIYRGSKSVSCPVCTAQFVPATKGKLCTVCNLATVGAEGTGLKNVLERR